MAINDCFVQNRRSSGFLLGNGIFLAVEQRFQTLQVAFLYCFVNAFNFLLHKEKGLSELNSFDTNIHSYCIAKKYSAV